MREILGEFIIWFRHSDYEPLFSPFNVTLYNGDDTINVVQPDILIISDKEEIDSDMDRYNGIPILVVEVISESTRKRDFVKKLDLYMSSGIREYWLVNPFSEEIVVYIFKNKDIINMFTFKENEIVKSGVFDGLSVSLKDVFR